MIHVPNKKLAQCPDFNIANILALRHVLTICSKLGNLLCKKANELAQMLSHSFLQPEFEVLMEKLDAIINPECNFQRHQYAMTLSKINAIKPGFDPLLDLAKENFNEIISAIDMHIAKCSIDHGLPLKCVGNQKSGFFISMPAAKSTAQLPKIFINVGRRGGHLSFTTLELLKLNEHLKECSTYIFIRTNHILSELLEEVKIYLKSLYIISGAVSLLDFLMSLAIYRISNKMMSKPQFSDTLAIKDSRHPILDALIANCIPNNVFCYDGCNFQVLTAPNMSGKTTYMKQVALLVIQASIGSWVPATYASVRVTDKILSRFTNTDDISLNSSTFLTEMKEMAFIMKNLTTKSLVLIDELGRSTSKIDGIGITFAICEKLVNEKSFVYFATHFSDLADFLKIYPNVHQMTLGASLQGSELCFDYVVQKGPCRLENYGIKLAEKSGYDRQIIKKAYEIANEIKEKRDYQRHLSSGTNEIVERQKVISFATKMQHLVRNSTLTRELLLELLKQKIDEFNARS